ncbi:MAG: leucine-rich repeat protein [Clostridia bacterium]
MNKLTSSKKIVVFTIICIICICSSIGVSFAVWDNLSDNTLLSLGTGIWTPRESVGLDDFDYEIVINSDERLEKENDRASFIFDMSTDPQSYTQLMFSDMYYAKNKKLVSMLGYIDNYTVTLSLQDKKSGEQKVVKEVSFEEFPYQFALDGKDWISGGDYNGVVTIALKKDADRKQAIFTNYDFLAVKLSRTDNLKKLYEYGDWTYRLSQNGNAGAKEIELWKLNKNATFAQIPNELPIPNVDNSELFIQPVTDGEGATFAPVTQIKPLAFCGRDNVERVVFGDNVRIVSEDAFVNSKKLKYIDAPTANAYFSSDSNGILYDKNKETLIKILPRQSENFVNAGANGAVSEYYVMPDSVLLVAPKAISCTQLTGIYFNSKCETIGDKAFWGSKSLEEVIIPYDSILKEIGKFAFENCFSLAYFTLPTTVKCVDDNAFASCTSLRKITLPKNMDVVGERAFFNCNTLEYVNFDAVYDFSTQTSGDAEMPKTIGDDAFLSNLDKSSTNTKLLLSEIFIYDTQFWDWYNKYKNTATNKNSLAVIGKKEDGKVPDWECVSVNGAMELVNYVGEIKAGMSITLPSEMKRTPIKSIGSQIFGRPTYGAGLETITVASSITKINDYAFVGLHAKKLTMPNKVATIGKGAFSYGGWESVQLSTKVTSLPEKAFYRNQKLQLSPNSVELANITSFGKLSLAKCDLRAVTIGANVQTIEAGAFAGNSQLNSFAVDHTNRNFAVGMQGELYKKNADGTRTILQVPANVSIFNIEQSDNVKRVEAYAFWGCGQLEYVAIAMSGGQLGEYIFNGCDKLQFINISSTTPPTLEGFFDTNMILQSLQEIKFANSALAEEHKTAPLWLAYADKIK